jgi:hypothetical protein
VVGTVADFLGRSKAFQAVSSSLTLTGTTVAGSGTFLPPPGAFPSPFVGPFTANFSGTASSTAGKNSFPLDMEVPAVGETVKLGTFKLDPANGLNINSANLIATYKAAAYFNSVNQDVTIKVTAGAGGALSFADATGFVTNGTLTQIGTGNTFTLTATVASLPKPAFTGVAFALPTAPGAKTYNLVLIGGNADKVSLAGSFSFVSAP